MSDTDTLFALLAADPRRRILLLLCQTDSIRVPEGIQTRGGTQSQQPTQGQGLPSQSDSQEGRPLEHQLIHTHLPKLEDEELIEWDREAQTVSRGPQFEAVEPALQVLAANAEQFPDGLI